jgi:hypothetical protein
MNSHLVLTNLETINAIARRCAALALIFVRRGPHLLALLLRLLPFPPEEGIQPYDDQHRS